MLELPASFLRPVPRFDPLCVGACNAQPPLVFTYRERFEACVDNIIHTMYVRPRPEAHRSSERVFTYRERCRPHNRDQGCACFQEKYYLGYVLLEQLSIATDIQFHVFNFQICFHALFTKKKSL